MISDALRLRPATVAVGAETIAVSRPSVLDMIDALEHSRTSPDTMLPWLVLRHARDAAGAPMFSTLEEVMECDMHAVSALGQGIQRLYEEGRD